jgi:hypothetical protein
MQYPMARGTRTGTLAALTVAGLLAGVVAVTALIADKAIPRLLAKRFPYPLHSRRVQRHNVLLGAVDALRRSYTFRDHDGFNDHDKLRGYYKWLFEISDEYLVLLREADSDALCVLAYYSVLLRDLEKYWWMQGWSTHLMKRIYLMLDEVHRLSIRWPIEELGWIPDSG